MISGVILAGGLGRRMGQIDKGLQDLRGRPMVVWVAERLAPQVDELLINANQNLDAYRALGYPVVPDLIPDFAGPLAGLHAALSIATEPLVATAPCDSPFLPADLVARLHASMIANSAQIAVARTFEQTHPVFCLCQRTLLPHLTAYLAGGGRKFDAWYATLKVVEVNFDDEADAFENINTRDELSRFNASYDSSCNLSFNSPTPDAMSMLSFEAAKARLLDAARPVADTENIDLALAFGRALASDLVSPLTVPPFNNAAMDGYAVCAADLGAPGTRLRVSQRVAAGDAAAPLLRGTAARIFTGAPVPAGADTVVMQEDCTADGEFVNIAKQPPPGEHVRLAGADIRAGQVILRRGAHLSAAALGLAASVGIATVPVYRRLKVAIFFTGSELTLPGTPLAPGHIYNSNRYVMRGFLADLGAEIIDLGIVRDDREATRDALRRAATEADLIVTSGGMSEGEEDHVTAAVKAEGRIDVWKIAAKPGKPLAFGAVRSDEREAAFIGLPGNPVSVWSGLLTMVAPYLRRCQGYSAIEPARQTLRADFDYSVKGNRMEFIRVRRNERGGLDVFPTQDSSIISSAVWCDGVAAIPAGGRIKPGDLVDYLPGPGDQP